MNEFQTALLKSPLILTPTSQIFTTGEVWRLFTYQFIHANLSHLIVNMLSQLFIAAALEIVHGPIRIGIIYTLGVVLGACFHMMIDGTYLVGASGGVYALIGVLIANYSMNFREMSQLGKILRGVIIGVLILGEIGMSIGRMMTSGDNVSWSAHVGGFLVGMVLGIVILKNFVLTKKEIYIQIASIVTFVFLVVATITTILIQNKKYLTNDPTSRAIETESEIPIVMY